MKVSKTVYVDADVLKEIEKLAECEERSLSSYINLVLRACVRAEQNQRKLKGQGERTDT